MNVGPVGLDTVWSLVERRAALQPQEIGVSMLTADGILEQLSYRELALRTLRVAQQLSDHGVRAGDKVALLGLNSTTYVAVLAATSRLGVVVIPLNAVLTAAEIAFQLTDVGATAAVCDASFTATLDAAAEGCGWTGTKLVYGGSCDGWSLLDPTAGATFEGPARDSNDTAFQILYTSGTGSRPKGVLLSERSVVEEALRTAAYWAMRPDDVVLLVLPLFHVNAQMCSLFPALTVGAQLVLVDRFSASAWARQVRESQATICTIVGTQLRMLLAQPRDPQDADNRLRCLPYGLNVPLETWTEFETRFGAPLINMYGLTEALGPAVVSSLYGDRRIPSIGRIGHGREIMIADGDGNPVATGQPGEILIKGEPGKTLLMGYHGRPEETANTVRDGWLHTGDIGKLDEDGFVYFLDRSKDMIKRSGENVSASEVEAVINEMPSVVEVAVVGKPDPIRDEALVAFVVAADATLDADSVVEFCRARLARFKVPEDIRIVELLPKTAVGKIEKKSLRELALNKPANI